jgi:hypothetical protein
MFEALCISVAILGALVISILKSERKLKHDMAAIEASLIDLKQSLRAKDPQ